MLNENLHDKNIIVDAKTMILSQVFIIQWSVV
jgi:hypothetical protein